MAKPLGAYARHKARMEQKTTREQDDRAGMCDAIEASFDRAEACLMEDDLVGARRHLAAGFLPMVTGFPDAAHLLSARERELRRRKIGLSVSCIWLGHELQRLAQEEEQADA